MLSRRYDERGSASLRAFAHVTFFDRHRHAPMLSIACGEVALRKTSNIPRACRDERIGIEDNALRYKIGSRCAGT